MGEGNARVDRQLFDGSEETGVSVKRRK